jgi:hypothetical protein
MTLPTGLRHAVQQMQEWLKELRDNGDLADEAEAYSVLRAVLHQLGDRLTAEEAITSAISPGSRSSRRPQGVVAAELHGPSMKEEAETEAKARVGRPGGRAPANPIVPECPLAISHRRAQ